MTSENGLEVRIHLLSFYTLRQSIKLSFFSIHYFIVQTLEETLVSVRIGILLYLISGVKKKGSEILF